MISVNLPELVAGRDMADDLVDRLGRLATETVVLRAGNLLSFTASFATGLVQRILVGGDAAALVVVDAPEPFQGYLKQAAEDAGVARRLTLTRSQE